MGIRTCQVVRCGIQGSSIRAAHIAICDGMGCLHQARFDVIDIWKCIAHFFGNRNTEAALRLLVQVANSRAMAMNHALVSLFHPCEDFDKGRLAGAVNANDANTLLVAEDQGNVLEDILWTKTLGNFLCG